MAATYPPGPGEMNEVLKSRRKEEKELTTTYDDAVIGFFCGCIISSASDGFAGKNETSWRRDDSLQLRVK
jgi:hypothetical protein